jgi:16S rRNA (uracil1498-N3)-methyltransferase
MPSPKRAYYPVPVTKGQLVTLGGEEFHYLAHVRRAKKGDPVTLFGASDTEGIGTITEVTTSEIVLSVDSLKKPYTDPVMDLAVCIAVGKGKKLEEIVENGTVLGASRFCPFVGGHSVAKRSNPDLVERLQRIAVEACRQSRRCQVPIVDPVKSSLKSVIEDLGKKYASHLFLNEESGEDIVYVATMFNVRDSVALFVGPEGGWSIEEREIFEERESVPISLGPRILRTELAAMVAIATLDLVPGYEMVNAGKKAREQLVLQMLGISVDG